MQTRETGPKPTSPDLLICGAPFAGGYFVGDYEGLASAGNVFLPFFVEVNTGSGSNRTDVFAAD